MRIGVISDTHGNLPATVAGIGALQKADVQRVIHCGDVGSAAVVQQFAAWPTEFVLGNVDRSPETIIAAAEAQGHRCHTSYAELMWESCRIAVAHGHDGHVLWRLVESGDWDLVCTGHTHVAQVERHGPTLVLNPGAVFRASPRTLAIVTLPELSVEFLELPPPGNR